jgi:hypothetical protein
MRQSNCVSVNLIILTTRGFFYSVELIVSVRTNIGELARRDAEA